MVTYNSEDEALELSDEDKLKIGDYELGYDSDDDEFQIISPEGNVNLIPRSTEGSLVPQGLAESVSDGKALADDGEMYDTVQEAVDNATGWVFVGPGTFNESVTIDTSGLMLVGSGYDTLIDGGTTGEAIEVTSSNVVIKNFSLKTAADDNGGPVVYANGGDTFTIDSCAITEWDNRGIYTSNNGDNIITNCIIGGFGNSNNGAGLVLFSDRQIITNNIINGAEGTTKTSDNAIFANNILIDVSSDGQGALSVDNDCIVIGNRIHNTNGDGVTAPNNDTILANNRISDSSGSDIGSTGTGITLDANLTGASN